jgi:hypothetical protein
MPEEAIMEWETTYKALPSAPQILWGSREVTVVDSGEERALYFNRRLELEQTSVYVNQHGYVDHSRPPPSMLQACKGG